MKKKSTVFVLDPSGDKILEKISVLELQGPMKPQCIGSLYNSPESQRTLMLSNNPR